MYKGSVQDTLGNSATSIEFTSAFVQFLYKTSKQKKLRGFPSPLEHPKRPVDIGKRWRILLNNKVIYIQLISTLNGDKLKAFPLKSRMKY